MNLGYSAPWFRGTISGTLARGRLSNEWVECLIHWHQGSVCFFHSTKQNLGDWSETYWLCQMIYLDALLHIRRQKDQNCCSSWEEEILGRRQKKISSGVDVFCIGCLFAPLFLWWQTNAGRQTPPIHQNFSPLMLSAPASFTFLK